MTDYTSTTPQFDSNILTLQNLNSEFNVVMKQYEQTKKNYIANLKKRSTQDDSKKYTPEYTVEKGLGFYEGSDSTHVLNTTKSVSLEHDYKTMDTLNQKLMDLSAQIQDHLNTMSPTTTVEIQKKDEQRSQLQSVYDSLNKDRAKIKTLMDERYKMENESNDNILNATQNKSHFILWGILAIIITVYLVKVLTFPNAPFNIFSMFFWFGMIILFIMTTIQLNTPMGFLTWGVLILFFVATQMKLIPTP